MKTFLKKIKTERSRPVKRSRGSQRQSNVAVMTESTKLEDQESGKKKHVRFSKMKVLKTHKKEKVNNVISKNISEKSTVFSDKSTSYNDIADYVEIYMTEKSDEKITKETLKWSHVAISNAKRTFLDIL
mgnify:CR=1 FL=1